MNGERSLDDLLGTVLRPVADVGDRKETAQDDVPPPGQDEPSEDADRPAGHRQDTARDQAAETAPAYLYVPTRPYQDVADGPQPVSFELRRLGDGSAGLAVYTEPSRLIDQLGEFQPWVRIAALDLLVQLLCPYRSDTGVR